MKLEKMSRKYKSDEFGQVTKESMFGCLVDNAFDFLLKAIGDLENHPKYSVINFHASMELFIKARLMAEHWTLVVSRKQEPDWTKFIAGDFYSVSLDEAASRLQRVLNSGLSKEELNIFKEVAKHRNKMVHFFHEAHAADEDGQMRQEIVKIQLNAWYFLHRLLTEKWAEIFDSWKDDIVDIDRKLRRLHQFLVVVFENLSEKIADLKNANGIIFRECPSCGFESKQHEDEKDIVYQSDCLVCNLSESVLQIKCPDCGETVFFEGEGFSVCEGCEEAFEPPDLAKILMTDSAESRVADGDDLWALGNCSFCDGYHTVVRLGNLEYICAGCLNVFEMLEQCGWCGELNTGDVSDSYWMGCNFCDGKVRWDKS